MMKVVEYMCHNAKCQRYGQVTEKFLEDRVEDDQICLLCAHPLQKLMSGPAGYVRGTSNPVRV